MTKKNSQPDTLSGAPAVARSVGVQRILEISANAEGPVKSADEVEGLLIQEMRRLGNTTMGSWAARAEKRLAEQLEQRDAWAGVRKKKR